MPVDALSGQLLVSRGVIDAGIPPLALVVRHASGEWGDVSDDDRDLNERAVAKGGERIFSALNHSGGHRVSIITEAGRSATVLLPEDHGPLLDVSRGSSRTSGRIARRNERP